MRSRRPQPVMRTPRRKRIDTTHAHPLVRRLFQLIDEHQIALEDLADRSAVSKWALLHWRRNRSPVIQNLDAVLNVLGYQLYVKPIGGGRPRNKA